MENWIYLPFVFLMNGVILSPLLAFSISSSIVSNQEILYDKGVE
ncbi:hypothetical protein [Salibacterium lacus]|uniref:Uncharacterized protein n=1 Tax=Salibacterium lacus TaxID=1898109 RepID=A0ABW5T1R5_9BACI